ncbi:MAG: hypothetical protein ACKVOQ_14780 [Cyclobacteriaceae bacterium]
MKTSTEKKSENRNLEFRSPAGRGFFVFIGGCIYRLIFFCGLPREAQWHRAIRFYSSPSRTRPCCCGVSATIPGRTLSRYLMRSVIQQSANSF